MTVTGYPVWQLALADAISPDLGAWREQPKQAEASQMAARVDDLPMTFSRGLKQKAAIAMAFVRPFDVMLVDEPFVGLDQVGREALLELFELAHADGATLVVADGLGHGAPAAEASQAMLAVFRQLPQESLRTMLERGHAHLRSTRGAALKLSTDRASAPSGATTESSTIRSTRDG